MENEQSKSLVLTIHGVGGVETGSTLRGLSGHFESNRSASYSVTSPYISGVQYYRLSSDRCNAPDLIEINWTDIRRPPKSPFTEIWHLPKLLFAMLHLSEKWPGAPEIRQPLLCIYRLLIEFSVWMVPYIVYVMLLICIQESSWRLLFVFIASTAVGVLAFSVRKWSRSFFIFGILSSLIYLGAGLYAIADHNQLTSIAKAASQSYVLRHQSFPLLIYALFFVTMLSSAKQLNVEQRLTRFAFAYIPFLAVAVLGSLLWVITIPLVQGTRGYLEWSAIHASILQKAHYDLRLSEYSHLAAILLLGFGALAAVALYGIRSNIVSYCRMSGEGVRNAIPILAGLVPISLLGVTVVIIYGLVAKPNIETVDVLKVYEISALRVVPFLPWLLTPLRVVVDIIGDVVFTALPATHQLSIREQVLHRIDAVLDWASKNNYSKIVVFSHSLGTVLSSLAIAKKAVTTSLLTTGSPISTLHSRFLAIKNPLDPDKILWLNAFRAADYIGGPIPDLPEKNNIEFDRGGHTGYWDDPRILTIIEGILGEPVINE